MAFVPGFDHDVFVSYAHGDDRDWINRFLDRLKPALSRRLPGADVWIDTDDLRESRDFTLDIPASLHSIVRYADLAGLPDLHHPPLLCPSRMP